MAIDGRFNIILGIWKEKTEFIKYNPMRPQFTSLEARMFRTAALSWRMIIFHQHFKSEMKIIHSPLPYFYVYLPLARFNDFVVLKTVQILTFWLREFSITVIDGRLCSLISTKIKNKQPGDEPYTIRQLRLEYIFCSQPVSEP